MKISVGVNGELRLGEVFIPVAFETKEGEELLVCMRDGAFEIAVKDTSAEIPNGKGPYYDWYIASGSGIHRQQNQTAREDR